MDFLPGKKTRILALIASAATVVVAGLVGTGKLTPELGKLILDIVLGLTGSAAAVTLHQAVTRGK